MNHSIFRPDVLSIFTDSSTRVVTKGHWNVSSAAIAVDYYGNIPDTDATIFEDSTNNQGELFGIQLGVNLAIKHQDSYARVNLFTDSELSMNILRYWIQGWVRQTGFKHYDPRAWRHLTTSSGTPVKNLPLIAGIIDTIPLIRIGFNIYHVAGHSADDPVFVRSQFSKKNKINITINDAIMLAKYNDMVDHYTNRVIDEFDQSLKATVCPWFATPDLRAYRQVVRRFTDIY